MRLALTSVDIDPFEELSLARRLWQLPQNERKSQTKIVKYMAYCLSYDSI